LKDPISDVITNASPELLTDNNLLAANSGKNTGPLVPVPVTVLAVEGFN
jgi:hypothetical protein